jgi:hypothetical protein
MITCMISSQNEHFMRYTDHVRRSGCHKVLIENDTNGPHSVGPHDGPHTIQYRIVAQCIDR